MQPSSQPISSTSRSSARIPPYRFLDACRGFAALWVVIHHAYLSTILKQPPTLELLRLNLFDLFSLYGYLGVPIFFVISGYCIANAAANARNKQKPLIYFVWSRIRRIYPPYFAALALTILASLLISVLVAKGVLKSSSLAQGNFLQQNLLFYVSALTLTAVPLEQPPVPSVAWTLCYEAAFYAIVALVLKITARSATFNTCLNGLNYLTALSLIWLIISPNTCPFPMNLFPQFSLGIQVFYIASQPKQNHPKVFFGLTISLMLLFAWLNHSEISFGEPSIRLTSLFSALFAVLILLARRFDEKLVRQKLAIQFCQLGVFSYSLYLTHQLCLGSIAQLGRKISFFESRLWIVLLIQVIAAILFAKVFFLLFERPFLKLKSTPK